MFYVIIIHFIACITLHSLCQLFLYWMQKKWRQNMFKQKRSTPLIPHWNSFACTYIFLYILYATWRIVDSWPSTKKTMPKCFDISIEFLSRINEKSRIYDLYLTLKIEFFFCSTIVCPTYTIVQNQFLGWDKGHIRGTSHLFYLKISKVLRWIFQKFSRPYVHWGKSI